MTSMKQKRPTAKVTRLPKAGAAPKTVTILGATGSIGSSTADLLRRDPDSYAVEAVTANRDAAALARLARELGARFAAVADQAAYAELKSELSGSGIEAAAGAEAMVEAAQRPAEWVMAAITGAASLAPTLAAAERGATVALANKECLVCAGALFMRRAAAAGANVLPVDSEHNAIFQALGSGRREDVRRIILTASGRPVPHLHRRADPQRHRGAGAQASDLVDGTEDHHRFRDPDEQGPRTDRGASPVRAAAGRARRRRPSAVDHSRPGRIPRRLGDRPAWLARHANPDLALPGLAGADGNAGRAAQSGPGFDTLTSKSPT